MTISIADVFPKMTKRQREVCVLLIMGYSNKEAAHALNISPRTIEDHRREVMRTAGVVSRSQLTIKLLGSPEVIA